MSTSDIIAIICAAVSLIVTIIIAALQLWQNNRMEKFEIRQDERDEQRHAEEVKAKAITFISKNYENRGLIPLCAIAAMYNGLYYYTREMYREFCCCTTEVQNKILEYCELDLHVVKTDSIYYECLEALEQEIRNHFPSDKNIYYEGGKYIERSLINHGADLLPHREYDFKQRITDVLAEAYRNNNLSDTPIEQLCEEYNFSGSSEIEACQLATIIAEYIAIYGHTNTNSEKNYGSPGAYDGETIDTMEDLFLLAVFEMYVNLILKD